MADRRDTVGLEVLVNLYSWTVAAAAVLVSCSSQSQSGFGEGSSGGSDSSSGLAASSAGHSGTSATGQGGASSSSISSIASGSGGGSTASTASTGSEFSSSSSSSTASASSSASSAGDQEPPDMVGMTAAHNAARAAVMPVASPSLPTDTWSSTVAASAQAFANNCVFADTGPPYGSNAFAGTGTYTPAQVVDAWVGEDADYDYASNSCTPGAECGHYTQVVWRDSTEIGCGVANCTINSPFGGGPWQLWICNYNPPGNYVGEKPY